MLFEMLAGRRPFELNSVKEMMHAHVASMPPTFAELGVTDIPVELETVIRTCLAKAPDARPQNAAALAHQFEEALGQRLHSPIKSNRARPARGLGRDTDVYRPFQANQQSKSEEADAHTFRLEVNMPESIATLKLRGFIQDLGGEIVESVPGLIRVHLHEENSDLQTPPPSGFLSWFSKNKNATTAPPRLTELQLHMSKLFEGPKTLALKMILKPKGYKEDEAVSLKRKCDRIFRNLQAYLHAR
jgi:serine/threonine-protein kinase